MASEAPLKLKACFIGDGAVGKTSSIQHAADGVNSPVLFQSYSVQRKDSKGRICDLSLHDTGGQDEYASQRAHTYVGVDVFVLCFSVISPQSLLSIKEKWLPELLQHNSEAAIVLVATKTDLRQDGEIVARLAARGLAPISPSEGRALAKEIRAAAYLEISPDPAQLQAMLDTLVVVSNKRAKGAEKGCAVI